VEGAPLRQTETVLATAAGNAEAGPSEAVVSTGTIASDKVGLIRQVQTPLFLLSVEHTEPSDESYINEAKGSGSKDKNVEENEDEEEANEMDVDQILRD
jgi:hypothetical protein